MRGRGAKRCVRAALAERERGERYAFDGYYVVVIDI